jgi:hypothetical protein
MVERVNASTSDHYRALILGALAFAIGLASPASPARAADRRWDSFEWVMAEVVPGAGLVKAGVVLPVKINGIDCYAQLDTGADGMIIWRTMYDTNAPFEEVLLDIAGKRRVVRASASQLAAAINGTCKTTAIPTVGNAFFDDGTLILDLKGGRFQFDTAAILESEPKARHFQYAQLPGNQVGGHIIVQIGLPSGEVADAMFDTGAASFGLSTFTAADWNKLTGGLRLRASRSVKTYAVNSWGKQITCYSADAPSSLLIAPELSVSHFRISYCAASSFKPRQELIGLLGLLHLNDKVITLDYRSRKWLISN